MAADFSGEFVEPFIGAKITRDTCNKRAVVTLSEGEIELYSS